MAQVKEMEGLQAEIDGLDEALHDLIMRRAELTASLGELKQGDVAAFLRPAQHAGILRRLIARHGGPFPKTALVRIWNELQGAPVGQFAPFSLAVFMPARGAGYLELARDQYGAYTPATVYRSVGQVVRAVTDGLATVGIIPTPNGDEMEPWWVTLMPDNPDIPRIIARLPFLGPGIGRGDGVEALAIARVRQDATGFDRTWLAIETQIDVSRARLLGTLESVGIEATQMAATHYGDDFWLHLVEVAGFVDAEDRRFTELAGADPVRRIVSLGGYAIPLRPEELSD